MGQSMSRSAAHFAIWLLAAAATLAGCDATRSRECKQMLSTTQDLEGTTPSSTVVDRMEQGLDPPSLEDKPLSEYASSLRTTLSILHSTLVLNEGPSPPDGTNDVVVNKLKAARIIRADVVKYCGL